MSISTKIKSGVTAVKDHIQIAIGDENQKLAISIRQSMDQTFSLMEPKLETFRYCVRQFHESINEFEKQTKSTDTAEELRKALTNHKVSFATRHFKQAANKLSNGIETAHQSYEKSLTEGQELLAVYSTFTQLKIVDDRDLLKKHIQTPRRSQELQHLMARTYKASLQTFAKDQEKLEELFSIVAEACPEERATKLKQKLASVTSQKTGFEKFIEGVEQVQLVERIKEHEDMPKLTQQVAEEIDAIQEDINHLKKQLDAVITDALADATFETLASGLIQKAGLLVRRMKRIESNVEHMSKLYPHLSLIKEFQDQREKVQNLYIDSATARELRADKQIEKRVAPLAEQLIAILRGSSHELNIQEMEALNEALNTSTFKKKHEKSIKTSIKAFLQGAVENAQNIKIISSLLECIPILKFDELDAEYNHLMQTTQDKIADSQKTEQSLPQRIYNWFIAILKRLRSLF